MKALKLNNKFSTIVIVFIVIALPLFIWAVVNLNFNYKKKAGGNITSPIIIQESFDGNGSIDSTKWGWSGSTGSSVTLESDKLKISVLEGHDQVGGNDAVAFVYFNSLIRYATGPFDVKVDITKLETTSGQSCLKFGAYTIGICRVKKGANETIETWTGSTSTGILSDKLSGFDLPSGTDSVTVRMERTNTEINTYYDLGDGFVLSGTTNSAPQLLEDMMLPTLIVENLQTSYPATIAYFDNYYASATIITATPAPTPRDNAINWSNQWVDLTASNFYIVIDGKGLFVGDANVAINSDHGHPDNYLTLETTWYEGPNPMRLFIYFRKNSDNTWTAFEIRSYNGDPSNGDWLYYEPLSPLQLGQSYSKESVDWYSTDGKGHIYFENLNLLPFKNLIPSPSPASSVNPIDWQTSDIHISADDFYVTSNNKKYTGQSSYVSLVQMNISNSIKGLEVTSNQHGDTLKMFIDFRIDGSTWYVYEVRIYDSNISNNWVSYPGPFVYTGLGYSNQKNGSYYFTLRDPNTGSSTQSISFTNLRIQAFTNSTPPPTACPNVPFTITAKPEIKNGVPGETIRYEITVTNNDSTCGPLHANMIVDKPSNWIANFNTQNFVTNYNVPVTTYLDVTSPTSSYYIGDQPINVRVVTVNTGNTASKSVIYKLELPPSATPKVGDVNNDGKVNLIDIGLLIDQYDSTNPANPKLDINGDGIVNVIDIGFIIDAYEW